MATVGFKGLISIMIHSIHISHRISVPPFIIVKMALLIIVELFDVFGFTVSFVKVLHVLFVSPFGFYFVLIYSKHAK